MLDFDFTPVQPTANPRFKAPYDASPSDLFDLASNRFVRKNNNEQVMVFVDGACLNNGSSNARAGYAVYVGPRTVLKSRLEPAEDGSVTSNRAELKAAIVALDHRFWKGEGFDSVVIASDAQYVVKGYCEWFNKWKKRNWTTCKGSNVLNQDLWLELDHQVHRLARTGVEVLFWNIPREWNVADKFAKEAAAQDFDAWHLF